MKTRVIYSLLASLLAVPAWAGPRDEARNLVDAHQYPAALSIFNKLVQANPRDIDLLIETARVNAWDDRHEAAIALYRGVMERAPARSGDVRLPLAWQLLWAGKAIDALPLFDAALNAQPANTDALHGKAEALTALHRPDDALVVYRRILSLAPTDTKAQLNAARLMLVVDEHQYPAALAIFDELLKSRPNDVELLIEAARANAQADRHEAAIALYRRVMERDLTRISDLRLPIAWQLLWAGKPSEALPWFKAALSAQPDNSEALQGKAEALTALHRPDDALVSYRRILALAPTDTKAQLNAARLMLLVDEHQYPAALAIFDELVKARPNDLDLLIEAARANAQADRHEAAIALYRRVMERAPARLADVRLPLAWQLLWAEKPADALVQFDDHLVAQPSNIDALHGKAEALAALNKLDEAAATYRQILGLAPDDAKAQLNAARVLLWQGQDQAAQAAFRRILSQHPDNRQALTGLARAQNNLGLHQHAARNFASLVRDDGTLKLEYARALNWAGMDDEAVQELHGLDAPEAFSLRQRIQRELSPKLSFNAEFSTDSDRLDISAATIQANFSPRVHETLELSLRQAWLDQQGSHLDGQTYWLGYGWRTGGLDSSYGLLWPSLYLGLRDYGGWQSAAWKARAKWLPADRWRWDFEAGNEIVENIASIQNHVSFDYLSGGFDFRPAPLWLLNLGVVGGRFDDGNQRKKLTGRIEYRVTADPRLTVGVEGMGFNDSNPPSPGRGYYSPETYREIKLAGRLEATTHGWELYGKAALGELWEQPGSSSNLYQVEASATHATGWGDVRFYAGRSDSASLTSGGGGYWRSYVGGTVNVLF